MLTLTPAQAADRLGVSGTALRRAAPIYERHFGPLPREGRGGRLWTAEAVEHLRLAFDAVHRNQVVSITAALEMLSAGNDFPVVQASGGSGQVDASTGELLRTLLSDVQSIRAENAELKALAEAQGRELAALRSEVSSNRVLPPPEPPGDLVAEVQELRSLVIAQGEREAERFRLAAHVAPAQVAPRPARGGLLSLLRLLGVRP